MAFPSDGIFHNGAKSSVPDQDQDDRSIFEIRRRRGYRYRSSSSSVRAVPGGIFSTTDIKDLKLSRRCACFSFNSNHFIDYTTTCKCLSHGQPRRRPLFFGHASGLALDALYHGNESTGSLMAVSKNR